MFKKGVLDILKQRGRPHHKTKNEPQPFCGLLHCAACNMMITGECKVKRQKHGNVNYYTYYHCSRKSKAIVCKEPCIRQEELDAQVSSLLHKFSLSEDWAAELTKMLEKDEKQAAQSSAAFVQEAQGKIEEITTKLQRLLDSYLEQDVEREVYLKKKAELMSGKKSLEEKSITLEQKQTGWVEPMRKWIKQAENLPKIARDSNLFGKKVAAKEIFGSNLLLAGKEARLGAPKIGDNWGQNQWAALQAAHQMASEKPKSFVLVAPTGIEPVLPH